MELELHQIELKYEGLRILDQRVQARLVASMTEHGQRSSVVVVRAEIADRYVLIDGYRRVAALRRLGVDTAAAVVLDMGEMDALLFNHRQAKQSKRSALEDGWLIVELVQQYGLSMQEIAVRLGRSKSWVSRRQSLVKQLPKAVQQLVRGGKLCAHAAQKYLVPLARANRDDCIQLAKGINGQRLSARQVRSLYIAWRMADEQERRHIVQQPLLYLKAAEEVSRPDPDPEEERRRELLRDLEALAGICHRAKKRLSKCAGDLEHPAYQKRVNKCWRLSCLAFETLGERMEEWVHA